MTFEITSLNIKFLQIRHQQKEHGRLHSGLLLNKGKELN